MKKILCPTDFTEVADEAVAYAAKVAQKTGSHLDLYNVQSLVDRTPDEAILGERMNAQMAYDRLEELAREISRVFKISCNGKVSTTLGSLSGMIEREAGNHDLVVMGTRGADTPYPFFFGSNAYQIARRTQSPVLILPRHTGYTDIRKTAFAFDYWRNNTLPLAQLQNVIRPLHSELIILEVLEASVSRKAEMEVTADQQMIMDSFGEDFPLRFDTLHTQHLPEALDQYVKANQIDLLALCSQHQNFIDRLFHKSLIKAISRLATYPLLVVHA